MLRLRIIFLFSCLVAVSGLLADAQTPKTNRSILIINAYHSGYEWSDNETKGIIDAIDDLEQPPVVYIEYLDTKRQLSEEHLLRMKEHIQKKYSHLTLDLVVAQDNWGLEFIQRYRQELFPNVKIVFCGINGKSPEELSNISNATGLLERHDLINTINTAITLHPQTRYVYILSDSSISSKEENSRLINPSLARDNVDLRYIVNFSWNKISNKIANLPNDSVLILGTSITDKYYRVLSGKDIGRIIANNSKVPVYTTLDIFMGEGIIGGHLVSAYNHGFTTGQIVRKILNGTSPRDIPITYDTSLQWRFNYNSLVHWNIYKSELPEGSVIVEKPESYTQILWWIIPGILFILFQFALIMFLLIARSRWKTAVEEIVERERHLTLLMEYTPMPMTILNTKLEYEYVNQSFVETFGYTETDLLNFHLAIRRLAASDEVVAKANLLMKEFLQQSDTGKEFILKAVTKDNREIFADTYYSRVGDKIIIAYHDITSRIQIEENLKKARDAERGANKAKSQFLANMSHEIRTPMNAVLGMAQLLNQTGLSEEQEDYIDTILNSGELLLTVINDLLDLSKIEAGHFEIISNPLDLRSCITQCTRLMEANFKKKNLLFSSHISENCPQIVYGDQSRIQQILLNVLNNACKYTESGSVELNVDASNTRTDTSKIIFHVKDTGIGIKASNIEKIFKPFNQGDSSNTRKYGGTGLGLTIVKRMIGIMGGQIDVTSKENIGSIFTITLPMKRGTPETIEPILKKKNDAGRNLPKLNPETFSILLTEDNEVNLKLTHIILKKLGLKADTAHNGREAIEMLQKKYYDIILMDIQMPVMDGTTATQIIRKQFPKDKQPYIIAMTAHAMASDAERFLKAGMNDYISKPIKINLLKEALFNVTSISNG